MERFRLGYGMMNKWEQGNKIAIDKNRTGHQCFMIPFEAVRDQSLVKLATILLVQIMFVVIFLQLMANVYGSSSITNTTINSSSDEPRTNSNSSRSHTDLIRTCSSFRDILSEDSAYSCDYSMLYYKGQCEFYSRTMIDENGSELVTLNGHDFSFCSDPRVDEYIVEHGLDDAPRSPTLIPME